MVWNRGHIRSGRHGHVKFHELFAFDVSGLKMSLYLVQREPTLPSLWNTFDILTVWWAMSTWETSLCVIFLWKVVWLICKKLWRVLKKELHVRYLLREMTVYDGRLCNCWSHCYFIMQHLTDKLMNFFLKYLSRHFLKENLGLHF